MENFEDKPTTGDIFVAIIVVTISVGYAIYWFNSNQWRVLNLSWLVTLFTFAAALILGIFIYGFGVSSLFNNLKADQRGITFKPTGIFFRIAKEQIFIPWNEIIKVEISLTKRDFGVNSLDLFTLTKIKTKEKEYFVPLKQRKKFYEYVKSLNQEKRVYYMPIE